MITNILLGLILITLIIIICGRQEKHTITMFIQDNEKMNIPNTIEVVDLRDPASKLPDCKEEYAGLVVGEIYSAFENPFDKFKAKILKIDNGYVEYEQMKTGNVESYTVEKFKQIYSIRDSNRKKEIEHNQIVKERPNQTNPKHEHTQEQLDILIKLAGKELTDEQVKIYFSKATNTLVYRYEDTCVKKEYHGKDFLNYTLLKHNRVVRVLYKEDLKDFDKVVFKQEVKEEKREIPQESEYREKVKDFMNLKRSTMLPDESLIKKVGISREMLHRYISKEEMDELKELRKTCQSIGIGKIKQKGLRGNA